MIEAYAVYVTNTENLEQGYLYNIDKEILLTPTLKARCLYYIKPDIEYWISEYKKYYNWKDNKALFRIETIYY